MEDFIFTLLKTVGIQLFSLFGIFFVLGFILLKLQAATNRNYTHTIGWKGILLTAWIGTPIHEIGHVIFAKIFHHRITNISLFSPNESTGGLGHVEHEFYPYSLYQRVGNFFIGAAPMIWGSIVLVAFLYFLVPNAKEIFSPLTSEQVTIPILLSSIGTALLSLLSFHNIESSTFWVFLYLSFCISSHIGPSRQDLKGMWSGLTWMIVILILINIIPLLLGVNITHFIVKFYFGLTIFISIFLYVIVISLLHLFLSFVVLRLPFFLLKR